jgi:hypothetical protein
MSRVEQEIIKITQFLSEEKAKEVLEFAIFIKERERQEIINGLQEAINELNSDKLQKKTKTLRNLIDEL